MNQSLAPAISVVIPMHNEAGNLDALFERLKPVLEALSPQWEVVLVDDGSLDNSYALAGLMALKDPRIRAIKLSRNFGKEIAIACGLHHARGGVVVLMDADLQHPPELIPEFVKKWQEGFDMVYGIRADRHTDGYIRRKITLAFYKIFSYVSNTNLPQGAGDFRLMSRKVVDALNQMGERTRFTKGLYSWVGFNTTGIEFDMNERNAGVSQWGFKKLLGLAIDGITAFSTMPLRMWTYVGVSISSFAFLYALLIMIRTLIYGSDTAGFPTLIVSIMLLSGIQLISLGVLGEYLGRIFTEVKARPMYLVAEDTASPTERRLS